MNKISRIIINKAIAVKKADIDLLAQIFGHV